MTQRRSAFPVEGAVPIWRRFFRHRFWKERRRFSRAEAWLDCLRRATYSVHDRYWHGRRIRLGIGEFVTSEPELMRDWHRSKYWVRSFLEDIQRPELCEDGVEKRPEAHVVAHHWGTMITVLGMLRCADSPTTPHTLLRPTDQLPSDCRATTIEERKERKEEPVLLPRGGSVGSARFPAEGVGRVYEAFQKATGRLTRPPSARERTKMQAVIDAHKGDWRPIAEFVGDVTAAAIRDGEDVKSVCYGLAAWTNKQDERISQTSGDRRSTPEERPERPAYHELVKVIPKPLVTDADRTSALEHIKTIIGRVKPEVIAEARKRRLP